MYSGAVHSGVSGRLCSEHVLYLTLRNVGFADREKDSGTVVILLGLTSCSLKTVKNEVKIFKIYKCKIKLCIPTRPSMIYSTVALVLFTSIITARPPALFDPEPY
jgi:hypothetical protein